MTLQSAAWPVELRVHRMAQRLEIDFDSGERFSIAVPLLRAMTPSAAERGHGGGAHAPLPKDFGNIGLVDAQPVGAYAVRLCFSDGHDTGIYTWAALYNLGLEAETLTADHARLLAQAKADQPPAR